jgi:GT2 family glycosyltransferase
MNIKGKLFRIFLYYFYIFGFLAKKISKIIKSPSNKLIHKKNFSLIKLKNKINYFLELFRYSEVKASQIINYFYKIKLQKKSFSKSLTKYSSNIKRNSKGFFQSIEFPVHKSPQVSIIIPVFKDSFHTALCLKSIQKAKNTIPFEVIVVDDSPNGEKIEQLHFVKNIKLVSNKRNIGYLNSCNLGASKSNAKYLCMLNNDTFVLDGWLDNLYDTFDLFPSAGIVGSMLLNRDFSVQEAGSFIFRNGDGYNFGKNFMINSFNVNFIRKVSYSSAASILVDAKLYKSVGGFDKDFFPAYYEDVDLAFKFLKLNKYVYCNPSSLVIHFGSVTMGQGRSPIKDKLMSKNKKIFISKWRYLIPNKFNNISQLRYKNKSIVFFEENLITPKSDAGSLSIFNFAKMFQSLGYEVVFYFKNYDRTSTDYRLLLQHGFQVICEAYDLNSLSVLKEFLKSNFIYPEILYIARPVFYNKYVNVLKKQYPKSLFIYDTVDLHFLRMQRENKILNKNSYSQSSINTMRTAELNNIQHSDVAIIRSKYEMNLLMKEEKITEKKLLNLSLLFPTPERIVEFKKSEGIVFVGNFNHAPNIDALNYFFEQIIVNFKKPLTNINIYIIGKNGSKIFSNKAQKLSNPIHFIDFVDDINSFLLERRLNIAPLRYGAGIKGKIAQAFINGLPTISTDIGFEGMSKSVTKTMQADNADEFVKLINKFYFSESDWLKCQDLIIKLSKIWLLDYNQRKLSKELRSFNTISSTRKIDVNLL